MTTRTLVILRHAKAATPEGMPDHERPLTERGHADAASAGSWLSIRGYAPQLVLCSTARRTRETWRGASAAIGGEPEVRYLDELYAASPRGALAVLKSVPAEVATVLLIGHNPTVSQLSALLDPDRADPEGLRTTGLAVHTLDTPWARCGPRLAPLAAAHTARASDE
jgi:phosphohistidine phosphatase